MKYIVTTDNLEEFIDFLEEFAYNVSAGGDVTDMVDVAARSEFAETWMDTDDPEHKFPISVLGDGIVLWLNASNAGTQELSDEEFSRWLDDYVEPGVPLELEDIDNILSNVSIEVQNMQMAFDYLS